MDPAGAAAAAVLEAGLSEAGKGVWNWIKRKTGRGVVPADVAQYQVIRDIRKGAELAAYRTLIEDKHYLRLATDGVMLRRSQGDPEQVKRLRSRIHAYAGPDGLRFAQAVQIGVVSFLLDHLQSRGYTPEQQVSQVKEFLRRVTFFVRFVEEHESVKDVFFDVDRALRERPIMYFIAGAGRASGTAAKVGQSAYESYTCFSRRSINEAGRTVFMLSLEPPGWQPPEVAERRRAKRARSPRAKKGPKRR